MKKLKFLFILAGLMIIGCSDLEEDTTGRLLPDTFFQTTQDVQAVINGSYGNMAEEKFWGRKFSLPLMLRSDMVGIGDVGTAPRRIDHDNFTVADDNGMISESWPRTYQIIAGANEAIAGAANLDISQEELNPVVAQAHFIRAYAYFHLVRLFGDIPYLDKPVTDTDAATSISKTPKNQVYANIIADLEFAKQWLPETQESRSLPSKASAAGYLSLVYLTIEDFQNAYNEAKYVIDGEGAFQLALENDFQDLFDARSNGESQEHLFSINYNGFRNGNYGQDYQPPLTGIRGNEFGEIGGGWSVAVPSIEVFNTWDPADYRKGVSLETTGIFDGVVDNFMNFPTYDSRNIPSAYIAKYSRHPGVTSNGNGRGSQHNYAQMRYAEVLLIAAEALNEISPGTAEADSYVNRIRARARNRDGNPSAFPLDVTPGLSQADFRTLVLEERKWELAFEFKRWYDIARRRLGDQVFGAGGLEERPNFSAARDYLLPLPADELQRNPNLLPQNNGY